MKILFQASVILVVGFFMLLSPQSRAQRADPYPNSNYTLDQSMSSIKKGKPLHFEVTYDDKVSQKDVDQTIRLLAFLAEHPPKNLPRHIFKWPDQRTNVENKKTIVHLIDSNSEEGQKVIADMRRSPGGFSESIDAFTRTAVDPKSGASQQDVFVFMDKITKDENGEPLTNFSAKLATVLAHELFGNVQIALETDFTKPPTGNLELRRKSEVRAFSAGIDFIEDLKKEMVVSSKLKRKIPPAFMQGLETQLEYERRALESWQRPPAQKPQAPAHSN